MTAARREVGLAEGCRRVMDLRDSLSKADFEDDDVVTLAGVGYELDDVPLGAVRERWDPGALAELDARVAAYLEPVIEKLLLACQRLVARWGEPSQVGRGRSPR